MTERSTRRRLWVDRSVMSVFQQAAVMKNVAPIMYVLSRNLPELYSMYLAGIKHRLSAEGGQGGKGGNGGQGRKSEEDDEEKEEAPPSIPVLAVKKRAHAKSSSGSSGVAASASKRSKAAD